jgi:hypothetical protein
MRPSRLFTAWSLAAALLIAHPRAALAGNAIFIDMGNDGAANALSIVQDSSTGNNSNTVNGPSGGTAPLTVKGAWQTLSINQGGGHNTLSAAVATSATTPGANSFSAAYAGGSNTQTTTIGATTPPAAVIATFAVTNTTTATTPNTISETLDTSATLTDGATIYGTNNSLTNTVAAGRAITLNTTIGDGGANGAANGNLVVNTASGLTGAYSATVTISGDGGTLGTSNAVQNTATGAGDRLFSVTLSGSSATSVYNALNGGAGTVQQSSAVTADSTTHAQYAVQSAATGTSSVNATLSGVAGGGIYVQQAAVSDAAVSLTVTGGGYTLGTLGSLPTGMTTTGLPANYFGGGNANPGVAVYQGSSTPITVTVTPNSNGYTASITHAP